MPSTPPQALFRKRRQIVQAGREAQRPAAIVIDGRTYQGMAFIQGETHEMIDGGFQKVQRFTATIRKDRLKTRPDPHTVLSIGDRRFKLMEIGGDNASDVVWQLAGMRIIPVDAEG